MLRIVLFLCFLVFAPLSGAAFAQDSLFTVEDVKVDVTADNAIKAREQAFEKAQQDSFKTLMERMVEDGTLDSIKAPPLSTISTLIQDYEVTEEKLSAVRYIGTYTVRFREKAVKQYFAGSGTKYTDVKSRPVLVLPFLDRGARTSLWAPDNLWMQAWGRANVGRGVVPLVVPLGDLQDAQDVGDGEALSYDHRSLSAMASRYKAGESVVAIAKPDSSLAAASGAGDVAQGVLSVELYRTDRRRPELIEEIVIPAQPSQTLGQLYDTAALKVHKVLQKDWKVRTVVSATKVSRLQVQIPFKTLSEWTQTRRALHRVQGVSGMEIKSLKPTGARVDLRYQGSEQRLRLALEQASMTLSLPRFATAGLGSPFGQPAGQAPASTVYELYLNRFAPRASGQQRQSASGQAESFGIQTF